MKLYLLFETEDDVFCNSSLIDIFLTHTGALVAAQLRAEEKHPGKVQRLTDFPTCSRLECYGSEWTITEMEPKP